MKRFDILAVIGVFALAVLLRAVNAGLSPVIATDSDVYLAFARNLGLGIWEPSLRAGVHPGYPFFIYLASSMFRYETAGYLVSVLFSSAAVLPLYILAREFGGRRAALLSALLFACLPHLIREHSDIMAEGVFHFFYLWTITLLWIGAHRGRLWILLLAALVGGCTYLTRPEGFLLLIPLIALPLLFRRPLAAVLAAGLFLLPVTPLVVWYSQHTGSLNVTTRITTEKVDKALVEGVGVHHIDTRVRGFVPAAVQGIRIMVRLTLFVLLIPIGFCALYGRRRRFKFFLIGTALLHAAAAVFIHAIGHALSHRYMMPTLLLLLPLAGRGSLLLAGLAARRWNPARVRVVATTLALLLLLGGIGRGVKPRREEQVPITDACAWVRKRIRPGARVFVNDRKLGWYLDELVHDVRRAKRGDPFETPLRRGEHLIVIEQELKTGHPPTEAVVFGRKNGRRVWVLTSSR